MTEEKLIHLLDMHKVVKFGHFKLTSGNHSSTYINKDDIWAHPSLSKQIISEFVDVLRGYDIEYLTGPAVAGAIMALPVSLILEVPFAYPEKNNDIMIFRRGFDEKIANKKVAIIEDIVTTGGSIVKTIEALEKLNCEITCITCLWNRGGWETDYNFKALISKSVSSFNPEACPSCQGNTPLTDPKGKVL